MVRLLIIINGKPAEALVITRPSLHPWHRLCYLYRTFYARRIGYIYVYNIYEHQPSMSPFKGTMTTSTFKGVPNGFLKAVNSAFFRV